MNATNQLIDTLAHSPTFREYQEAYTQTTGLPLALRPLEPWQLPSHGQANESPWCALIASQSRTCAACLRMQKALAEQAREKPSTLTCLFGIQEAAVPLKIGVQTVALLQTGQLMCHKPCPARFERALLEARNLGLNVGAEVARNAYFRTPVCPEKKLESIISLLSIFSQYLSMKSNEIAVHHTTAEPATITRAKHFIEDHHAEDITLRQVADATETSIFYFCKLFKRATGIHFTEYVSRVRVERARNLLLNPHLRISEIAYAVGFQSLTHFNRVFKTVAGESPTRYRQNLRLERKKRPARRVRLNRSEILSK